MNKFCPFIKAECREDCIFRVGLCSTANGTSACQIFIKLDCINEAQADQLTEIKNVISSWSH